MLERTCELRTLERACAAWPFCTAGADQKTGILPHGNDAGLELLNILLMFS
jgi:hypothetical protein